MSQPEVVVVGGINVDLKGQTSGRFELRTSNPGTLQATPGGVGRNIAENLARLDVAVTLLSAVGADPEGERIVRETAAAGVDLRHLLQLETERTGTYIALLDRDGELVAALADMAVLDRLSVEYLQSKLALFRAARYIVCDANIPEAAIAFLSAFSRMSGVPLAVEPVSVVKAQRVAAHCGGISLLTPNLDELAALTGTEPERRTVARSAQVLVDRGVATVITTLGEAGLCCTTQAGSLLLGSYPATVAEVTGAGDALTAGVIYGLVRGMELAEACRRGLAAAALTVAAPETVNPRLSRAQVEALAAAPPVRP
ncbi:carbohydrate kinase family protein [Hydrogenispora ethanolica]|nr:carbohydrate kinase family protein [Hydrogenispora ethanolica]